MGRMGYNLNDAADAAGVPLRIVVDAVNAGDLIAHRVEGKAVILATDIQTWLETLPTWLS